MKKILIIDDAKDTRAQVKVLLKDYNVEILEAPDGNDGWMKIIKNRPDLLILDLIMPEKDGMEVLKEVEEEWLGIPIIIISNDDNPNTIKACFRHGAKAVLKKPVILSEFKKAMEELNFKPSVV